MIDETGKKVWEETFDLWGKPHDRLETRVVGGAILTSVKPREETHPEISLPFRFPGQYHDEETGLYYNRYRYYMPGEGMYTQRDPIGLAGGNPTTYGYVFNTLQEVDPFGLNTELGNWGERVASQFLKKNGYNVLGSIQNLSNQGFDLIAIEKKTGTLNIIEVKTSESRWLSKSTMSKWSKTTLGNIISNKNGRWSDMPLYQKKLLRMIDAAENKKTLGNTLVQINKKEREIRIKCK